MREFQPHFIPSTVIDLYSGLQYSMSGMTVILGQCPQCQSLAYLVLVAGVNGRHVAGGVVDDGHANMRQFER